MAISRAMESTLSALGGKSNVPIFLGGAYRSGLTLLRAILDSHPEIACPPDLAIAPTIALQWEQVNRVLGDNLALNYGTDRSGLRAAFAAPIRDILASAARTARKRFIADKSPANVFAFPQLRKLFPESPLVHVLRDGRDVAASLLALQWRDPRTGNLLPMCASIAGAGGHWKAAVMQAALANLPENGIFVIRYEQLVREPEAALTPLLHALGLQFEQGMLRFHAHARDYIELESCSLPLLLQPLDGSRIGRWKRDLSAAQQREWEREFGQLQSSLGYVLG